MGFTSSRRRSKSGSPDQNCLRDSQPTLEEKQKPTNLAH
jgi:hypothetical protein